MTAVSSLAGAFAAPPVRHVPAAYWFWHRRPTADEVRRQVREIQAGGFGTFLIQARLAYPMEEYLDEGFLAAYRLAVEEAARLGLKVGIYDDYNWASGHAAGLTVAGHDHLRERMLFWSTAPVAGGRCVCTVSRVGAVGGASDDEDDSPIAGGPEEINPIQHWWYEDGKVLWADWVLVSAVAHPRAGVRSPEDVVDVTASARLVDEEPTGCRVTVEADLGDDLQVTAFVSARCSTSRLVNYLLPESAERFVEIGYEPFHRALGPFFGDPIEYMFVDHPQPGQHGWREHHGPVGHALQYDDRLRAEYERRHGAPFAHALLALTTDAGSATRRARADFFDTYADLTVGTFFGTIRRWADERGVGIAGHEMLSHIGGWSLGGEYYGRTDTRTIFGDDFFRIDGYRTHTTVDAVNFDPQITTRVGDSVARSHGRAGCIVEQYALRTIPGVPGAAGRWEMTLEEMRAAAIRHQLFGAEQYLFHGFYQTDGDDSLATFTNARFDFAPGVNFEPWYDEFHAAFAAESARLSAFMFTTEPACDAAILFPRVTRWVEEAGWAPYREQTGFWFRHLTERGRTFHLVDERDLAEARVEDGALAIGDRRYRTVVLPAVTAVADAATLELLADLARSGADLLASGPLVEPLDGTQTEAAAALRRSFADGAARHWPETPSAAEADDALGGSPLGHPLVVADDGRILWQWAGVDADGWRVAVHNDSADPVRVRLAGATGRAAERWDCATGAVGAFDTSVDFELAPMALLCLRIERGLGKTRPGAAAPPIDPGPPVEIASGWTLAVDGGDPHPVAPDAGWETQGHDGYSGLGVYRVRFDLAGGDAGDWELRIPRLHTAAQAIVNGTDLGRRGWSPYAFAVPAGVLRSAGNKLELRVWSSAGSRYYHGTPYGGDALPPSGLTSIPVLVPLERTAC